MNKKIDLFQGVLYCLVEWIVMMEDLHINHFFQIHSIRSIIVDKESENTRSPNVMDCRFGRSNHFMLNIIIYTLNYKRTITEIK